MDTNQERPQKINVIVKSHLKELPFTLVKNKNSGKRGEPKNFNHIWHVHYNKSDKTEKERDETGPIDNYIRTGGSINTLGEVFNVSQIEKVTFNSGEGGASMTFNNNKKGTLKSMMGIAIKNSEDASSIIATFKEIKVKETYKNYVKDRTNGNNPSIQKDGFYAAYLGLLQPWNPPDSKQVEMSAGDIFEYVSNPTSKDMTVQGLENYLRELKVRYRQKYASTGGDNQKRQRQQIVDGLAKIKLRF